MRMRSKAPPPSLHSVTSPAKGRLSNIGSLPEARRVKKTCQWHVFSQSGEQSVIATEGGPFKTAIAVIFLKAPSPRELAERSED